MNAAIRRPAVGSVTTGDRFWTPFLTVIRETTAPYVFRKFEETGYLANFEILAEEYFDHPDTHRPHAGPPFADGLVCESIRGVCDFLRERDDPALRAVIDPVIDNIVRASEKSEDGYFLSHNLLDKKARFGIGGDIICSHDLYDIGTLVEAAVSHYLATGKTNLLSAAVRAANCVVREIGEAPKANVVPGHSLPEDAFLRLYRLFSDHRELDTFAAETDVCADAYRSLAHFWYEARGNRNDRSVSPYFTEFYNQDHLPFAQQREAVGHAVRATLCYLGAASYVYETGDGTYLPALHALWENITERKLHISGGIGTRHDIEGFDTDYNLPNNAYLETCASVGLIFFAGAMALLEPKAVYYDVMERALYNTVLASMDPDGVHYFYQNPLESDGSIRRWDWHGCPCCPPMLLKLFSSLSSYIYSHTDDTLYVNFYIGSTYETEHFAVSQADGNFTVDTHGKKMRTAFRVPDYADGFRILVNGTPVSHTLEYGYAVICGAFSPDDTIEIAFALRLRRVCAAPAVENDRGMVCIMHGPYVMCAEGFDNDGVDFTVAQDPRLRLEGDTVIGLRADGKSFRLIPYYRWCRREAEDLSLRRMRVWFEQENMKAPELLAGAMKGRLYCDYETI